MNEISYSIHGKAFSEVLGQTRKSSHPHPHDETLNETTEQIWIYDDMFVNMLEISLVNICYQ